MNKQEAIKYLGVDICEFNDECDLCDNPQDGSYVSISNTDCGIETNYYICGKCLIPQAEKEKQANDSFADYIEKKYKN